eukprot:g76647.t1
MSGVHHARGMPEGVLLQAPGPTPTGGEVKGKCGQLCCRLVQRLATCFLDVFVPFCLEHLHHLSPTKDSTTSIRCF